VPNDREGLEHEYSRGGRGTVVNTSQRQPLAGLAEDISILQTQMVTRDVQTNRLVKTLALSWRLERRYLSSWGLTRWQNSVEIKRAEKVEETLRDRIKELENKLGDADMVKEKALSAQEAAHEVEIHKLTAAHVVYSVDQEESLKEKTRRKKEEDLVEYAVRLDERVGDIEIILDGVKTSAGAAVIAVSEGPVLFKLLSKWIHRWHSAIFCAQHAKIWEERSIQAGGVKSHIILKTCAEAERDLKRMAGAHGVDRRVAPTHNKMNGLFRAIKRVREMVALAESSYAQSEENVEVIRKGIVEIESALFHQAEALTEASGHHRHPVPGKSTTARGTDKVGILKARSANLSTSNVANPTPKDKAQELLKMLRADKRNA